MYELLIKLYYELDYRKFTINELSEIKEIVMKYKGQIESAKLVKVKEK